MLSIQLTSPWEGMNQAPPLVLCVVRASVAAALRVGAQAHGRLLLFFFSSFMLCFWRLESVEVHETSEPQVRFSVLGCKLEDKSLGLVSRFLCWAP